MDGLTFESMDDVLAELNAQFEAWYPRRRDPLPVAVIPLTSGDDRPADASSTIALSGMIWWSLALPVSSSRSVAELTAPRRSTRCRRSISRRSRRASR